MLNRNIVKSKDLCDQCKYTYEISCIALKGGSCSDCGHADENHKCLCDTIPRNTPCPYFEEYNNS